MSKVKPQMVIIAASVLALCVALVSQYGFGLIPCEMCIFQRWGYAAVILFALISVIPTKVGILNKIPDYAGMTIALAVTCGLAIFHFGIEQHWWEGFSSCSSAFKAGSLEDLKAQIMAAPVVRCDSATSFLFGLSMAGWNVLYSGALFVLAIIRIK